MRNTTYGSVSKKLLLENFTDKMVEVSYGNRYFDGILKVNGRYVEIHNGDQVYSIEKLHVRKRSINSLSYIKPLTNEVSVITLAHGVH